MFEKCQNTQTADLFPPLCVKFSCRAAARLQKFALIGDWIAVGGSAALRISHALWVNNLSPLGIPPIFKQGLISTDDFTEFSCERVNGKEGYITLIENLPGRKSVKFWLYTEALSRRERQVMLTLWPD